MSKFRRANISWLVAAAIWLAHAAIGIAAGEIEVVAISGDSVAGWQRVDIDCCRPSPERCGASGVRRRTFWNAGRLGG